MNVGTQAAIKGGLSAHDLEQIGCQIELSNTCLLYTSRASNSAALALYQKHGFERVGERKNYYEAPKEDAILMTRTVKKVEA